MGRSGKAKGREPFQRWALRVKRAAGARRPRGSGRAPGRDAAARSPRRRLIPIAVATYIEDIQGRYRAPSIKQHLAAIRRLFD